MKVRLNHVPAILRTNTDIWELRDSQNELKLVLLDLHNGKQVVLFGDTHHTVGKVDTWWSTKVPMDYGWKPYEGTVTLSNDD